jgi:hypothetical protein
MGIRQTAQPLGVGLAALLWRIHAVSVLLVVPQVVVWTFTLVWLISDRGWSAPSVITLSDNGLAFTAVAEIAGPFWSGRPPGTQNTSQLLTAGVAPPVFGCLIAAGGYPLAFAACAVFPLIALPLVPVEVAATE